MNHFIDERDDSRQQRRVWSTMMLSSASSLLLRLLARSRCATFSCARMSTGTAFAGTWG